jgi:uncharacterized membrane protein YgcG
MAMNGKQVNSHLHHRAPSAWVCARAIGVLFAALLANFAFSARASAAVVAPVKLHAEKLHAEGVPLIADELVTIDDVLAEVVGSQEWAESAGMGSGTAAQDSRRKNNSPGAPSDTPPGGSENAPQLNYGLLPVSSSSSTTGSGGAGSGGGSGSGSGSGSMLALSCAAAHLSADCMITRLVLADQLFPPSPPLCGIFHPPRVF